MSQSCVTGWWFGWYSDHILYERPLSHVLKRLGIFLTLWHLAPLWDSDSISWPVLNAFNVIWYTLPKFQDEHSARMGVCQSLDLVLIKCLCESSICPVSKRPKPRFKPDQDIPWQKCNAEHLIYIPRIHGT